MRYHTSESLREKTLRLASESERHYFLFLFGGLVVELVLESVKYTLHERIGPLGPRALRDVRADAVLLSKWG